MNPDEFSHYVGIYSRTRTPRDPFRAEPLDCDNKTSSAHPDECVIQLIRKVLVD